MEQCRTLFTKKGINSYNYCDEVSLILLSNLSQTFVNTAADLLKAYACLN